MTDLPLTIREHARARNVLVKLVPGQGIVVVTPKGCDRRFVNRVLEDKKDWISRTAKKMLAQGVSLTPCQDLPESISFPAFDSSWSVHYLDRPGKTSLMTNAGRLMVSGPEQDFEPRITLLKKFVADRARELLPPMLRQVSEELNLPFVSVRIRTQKSRWGSCSARKTISLNSKLLFLPTVLIEHLMVHELCHTVHLDHSPKYWKLVASIQPQYLTLERQLRDGNSYVPDWIL